MSRVMSFSRTLPYTHPGSLPPCPASITTVLRVKPAAEGSWAETGNPLAKSRHSHSAMRILAGILPFSGKIVTFVLLQIYEKSLK